MIFWSETISGFLSSSRISARSASSGAREEFTISQKAAVFGGGGRYGLVVR
jgi:hypothetical protein